MITALSFIEVMELLGVILAIVLAIPGAIAAWRQRRRDEAEAILTEERAENTEVERGRLVTVSALELVERLEVRIERLEEDLEAEQDRRGKLEAIRKEDEQRIAQERHAFFLERQQWKATQREWVKQLEEEKEKRRDLERRFQAAHQKWTEEQVSLLNKLQQERSERERIMQQFEACSLKLEKAIKQIEELGYQPLLNGGS